MVHRTGERDIPNGASLIRRSGVGGAAAIIALVAIGCASACSGPERTVPETPGPVGSTRVPEPARDAVVDGDPPEGAEPVRRVWPVMGTFFEAVVWEPDADRARQALREANRAVQRVDRLMSVYRDDSDLSRVNRRAGSGRAVRISPATAKVLGTALRVAERTGGALDITVGPAVEAWGFYRKDGTIPPPAVLDSVRGLVGYERVAFDRARGTVRLPRRGMKIDFGAIAKGYAADRAVEAMRSAGVSRGMVDLGGMVRTFGVGPTPDGRWPIGLRDPRRPDAVLAVVAIDSGAIATTGDYEQFFVHEGTRYSHVIDPRTAAPVRGVAGTSVAAPTAMIADALSTALFVLGPRRGCAAVRRFRNAGAVWVADPGGGVDAAIRPAHLTVTRGLAGRLDVHVAEGAGGRRPAMCTSERTR